MIDGVRIGIFVKIGHIMSLRAFLINNPRVDFSQSPKPSPPSYKIFFNFLFAYIKHLINRKRLVSKEVYGNRIFQCINCVMRIKTRCVVCGCYVQTKAWWASEKCPHKNPRWNRQEKNGV